MKSATMKVRGFIRGQIVDAKTGKVVGDSGVIKNVVVNQGRNAIASLIAAAATSKPTYAYIGSQNGAVASDATGITGTGNAAKSLAASGTSGTGAATFSCSFAGSDGALTVGGAGIYLTNNSTTMFAGQSFTQSAMATNQNFNLTYTIQINSA